MTLPPSSTTPPTASATSESRLAHWNDVYLRKQDAELSWFQRSPDLSLELIRSLHPRPVRVLDVGGGQSALAGALLSAAPADPSGSVAVLDVAPAAIERAKARVGAAAERIRWIVGDLLAVPDLPTVDLWHDRAVLHFLADPAEQRRYAERAAAQVAPGGHAVIACFAPSGPERCSGLPVVRRHAAAIETLLRPGFRLVAERTETHATPWGKPQEFAYAVLRRT